MISYGLDEAGRFIIVLFKIMFRVAQHILSWKEAVDNRKAGWNGKGDAG